MIFECFACPLSGQELRHPCPVQRCPANLADRAPTHSCAYVLPDTGHETLAEVLDLDTSEVRIRSQQELTELGDLMHEMRELLEADLLDSCPRCGYVEPCTSLTLCSERSEAVASILVNKRGEVAVKAAHLWYSIVYQRALFLNGEQRNALLELVNQKHVRKNNE